MDDTITQFVKALRNANVSVSPAETLDALRIIERVGLEDTQLFRNSLAMALAKSQDDKARFAECFDRFFSFAVFEKLRADVDGRAGQQRPEGGGAPGAGSGAGSGMASDAAPSLAELLLRGDYAALVIRFAAAAQRVGLENMATLRDKTHYVHEMLRELGVAALDDELAELAGLAAEGDAAAEAKMQALRAARARLQREVREFIESQYLLHVDATGKRAVMEAALSARLTQIQPAYYDDVRGIIEQIARKLMSQHARRRRKARRGLLDIRHTMRKNLAFDGVPFDLRWKRVQVQRPKVFALCDVSGSVAQVARFMLLMMYSLNELLPNIRTFAFSSELGEVSALFDRMPVARAIEQALFEWGNGTTDYARSLRDFREQCLSEIDRRSTVIVLGDGRNNYFDPRAEVLGEIAARAKQVLWLNPEPRDQWEVGDAEMRRFLPHCFRAVTCNSVRDLERFADQLLKLH